MRKTTKIFLRVCLTVLALAGAWMWLRPDYILPSEQCARARFESQRDDYLAFAALLKKDPSATFVGVDGGVNIDGIHKRIVPAYRDLINKIGAKNVIIREDGSMEFALWGHGSAITSDSYMGLRYFPNDRKKDVHPGWSQIIVKSLEGAKLPQEKGSIASGLYVVPIEPEWFVFRLEYQE